MLRINPNQPNESKYDFFPFPDHSVARVTYSMAFASLFLSYNKVDEIGYINPKNPITLAGDYEVLKYLWTAFMIFGKETKRFDSSSILFDTNKYDSNRLNYWVKGELISSFRIPLLGFTINNEEFQNTSLYNTEFKYSITADMLIISKTASLYNYTLIDTKTVSEPLTTYIDCNEAMSGQIEQYKKYLIDKHEREEEKNKRDKIIAQAKEQKEVAILQETARKNEEFRKKREEEEELRKQEEAAILQETARKEEEIRKQESLQLEKKNATTYLKSDIWYAIHHADTSNIKYEAIQKYVKNGADINSRYHDNNTLLIEALSHQKDQLAEYLLQLGADPFLTNDNGVKPIDLVVHSSPLFELLKQKEIEHELSLLPHTTKYNKLLLAEVCKLDARLKKIKEYLIAGAEIDCKDSDGNTPLMLATDAQNERCVEYLLKQGANALLLNDHKELASALVSEFSPLYHLIKKAEKSQQLNKLSSVEKHSILLIEHIGTPEANVQTIDEHLSSGADINYQNENKFTPLMIAIDTQNERIAEYLLQCGANPFVLNKNRKTARNLVSRNSSMYQIIKGYELIFATMEADLPKIELLLNNDINLIDFQGRDGYSALLIAVEQNMVDIVDFLLKQGANLNIFCEDGKGVFDLDTNDEIHNLLDQAQMPITTNSMDAEIVDNNSNSLNFQFFSGKDAASKDKANKRNRKKTLQSVDKSLEVPKTIQKY